VTGLTNRAFLETHAAPGRIGLAGGEALVNRLIRRAQRHVSDDAQWSRWSHAFLFGERRSDGHQWVIESDLEFHRKNIRLGVQENRAAKYHDEAEWRTLAVLDLGLDGAEAQRLIGEGLKLVAGRVRYSVRELLGTLIALRHPGLRGQANLLARDHALYCSAMVRHVFHRAGLDLTPGLEVKHTAPEDLARSPLIRTMYLLERETSPTKLERTRQTMGRLRARLKRKT
jgi:hypothetical protein